MKIIHLSNSDYGGAGLSALRVHKECLSSMFDSKFYTLYKRSNLNSVVKLKGLSLFSKFFFKIKGFLSESWVNDKNLFFSLGNNKSSLSVSDLNKIIDIDVDVVVIHWVADMFTLEDLEESLRNKRARVYFSLMDMAMFTGGCHYSYDCEGYKKQCFSCPEVFKPSLVNKVRKNMELRCLFNIRNNSTAVSTSGYLINQAKESSVPFHEYRVIAPALSNVFTFKEREKSKMFTILLGAYTITNIRKGYLTALLSLKELSKSLNFNKFEVKVLIPTGQHELFAILNGLPSINPEYYSFANSDDELAMLYNSADIFLNTSIDDSGPMMITESLYCGTPVLATKTGVAIELSDYDNEIIKTVDIYDYISISEHLYNVVSGACDFSPSERISLKVKRYYEGFPGYSKIFLEGLNE